MYGIKAWPSFIYAYNSDLAFFMKFERDKPAFSKGKCFNRYSSED